MMGQHRKYSAQLKAKVALEAIRGDKTVNELAALYQIIEIIGGHPSMSKSPSSGKRFRKRISSNHLFGVVATGRTRSQDSPRPHS